MPSPSRPLPPLSELRELFAYDPETGFITNHRIPRGPGRSRIAGWRSEFWKPDGYGAVSMNGRIMLAHRVAWALFYDQDPVGTFIDHINGDRRDNRIVNLRLCEHHENCLNQKRRSDNKTGTKCVTWDPVQRNYRVGITVKQRRVYLGRFKTLTEAVAAAEAARPRLHGEFARA